MAKEAQATVAEVKATGMPVTVRDRYLVYPESPLPEMNAPNALAYVAQDRRDPVRPLYALIGKPELPPRTSLMRALKGVTGAGLQQLCEWGVVDWPPLKRKTMVVVYERPTGGRVMPSLTTTIRRIDEYEIGKKVVVPLVGGLKELFQRGITHRGVRPDNMFWMEPRDKLVLGDCTITPAALDQPLLFETIESGMCHPAARGGGSYSDDLYALGVSLVLLLLGRNPVAHLDDDALLRAKIAQGSYAVLVGEERLPLSMIEVLRGLLCDDEEERWTMDSLDLWASGRRLSPLQPKLEKRGARGFVVGGKEYFTCRELGMALVRHWEASIPSVLEGKLELWLRRALEDKTRANTVANVVRNATIAAIDRRISADIILARVCMVLDSSAPIRYKGLGVMPQGFGPLLAVLMAEHKDTRLFAETIMREIPQQWFENRTEYNPEWSMLSSNFRELRSFLQQQAMGFGLERCLYELNETLCCQSPLVAAEYVADIRELLPALNRAAPNADTRSLPIDRHIVAFIAAHANFDVDRPLSNLGAPKSEESLLAMLQLLALLQWRTGNEPAHDLANWVAGLLEPVVMSYHSRERRAQLEKEIPRAARSGSLVELYNLVENAEERQRDSQGFTAAQDDYEAAAQEIEDLESGRASRDEVALRIGQQVAAFISAMIAMITLTVLVVYHLW